MSGTYTIKEVRGPGDYSTDSGQDAMVVLEESDAPNTPVALFVKKGSSVSAGEQVFGTITESKHGFRLKRQPREGAQRSSQPSQQSMGGGPRDDATGRSIERQTAAKCAARIIVAQMEKGDPFSQGQSKFAEWTHFLVDTFASAIRGE